MYRPVRAPVRLARSPLNNNGINMTSASYVAIPLSDTWEILRMLRLANRCAQAHTTNRTSDLEHAVANAESVLVASGKSPVGALLFYTSSRYQIPTYKIRTETSLLRAKDGWVVLQVRRVRDRARRMMLLLHPDLLDAVAKADDCYCAYDIPAAWVPVVATLAPECHASLLTSPWPDVRLAAIQAMS